MSATLRPIQPPEYPEALALWTKVFGEIPGYFERYFFADPWYRVGDCLGAWLDGQLVSAVHVCRRPLEWNGGIVWCGAVANVATLPEFRRQGLSRDLLRESIALMEREGFGFSMLFTGRHGHYAALRWEQVLTPRPTLHLSAEFQPGGAARAEWRASGDVTVPMAVDTKLEPRALSVRRDPDYWRGWVGWNWGRWSARPLCEPAGYTAVRVPDDAPQPCRVIELLAAEPDTEARLLDAVLRAALDSGRRAVVLETRPRWNCHEQSRPGVSVEEAADRPMMLRNVGLPDPEYAEVVRRYREGDAVWCSSDGF